VAHHDVYVGYKREREHKLHKLSPICVCMGANSDWLSKGSAVTGSELDQIVN
jgi:hypothetical protein